LASSDLGQLLGKAAETLDAAGIPSPRLDASLLIAAALGIEPGTVRLGGNAPVNAMQHRQIAELIDRRARREPVSRILGQREFWSLRFLLGDETLDPRPDSETLVEAVLARLPADKPATILDLGTGTGCLLLAILSERKLATGIGIDLSREAIRVAKLNTAGLGLGDRARFVSGDWSTWRLGPADVVISNPPYIASGDIAGLEPEVHFDPVLALDGGPDGLECYRSIASRLPYLVTPGGLVAFEIGCDQAESVSALLLAHDCTVEPPIRDLGGLDRVLVARR
jgi:release factor glutamine methyltransferase